MIHERIKNTVIPCNTNISFECLKEITAKERFLMVKITKRKKEKKETQACKLLSRIKIHVLTNKLRSKCMSDFLIIETHVRVK